MNEINLKKILDVGCGSSKISGAVGIDQFQLPGVDFVHNLNSYPWPFPDKTFDNIVFCHSISHLHDICAVMVECHRLLRNGGTIEIVAPHYASDNFNTDPTHSIHMGIRSMNYFVSSNNFDYHYLPKECNFELIKATISFREVATSWRLSLKNNFVSAIGLEYLVNMFPRIYERFFCWIFPCSEIYFLLKK